MQTKFLDDDVGLKWNSKSVGYDSVHWCGHVLSRKDGHVL